MSGFFKFLFKMAYVCRLTYIQIHKHRHMQIIFMFDDFYKLLNAHIHSQTHTSLLYESVYVCVCVHLFVWALSGMTNPHLCVGSVLLYMWELALIPQPITHHLRPCLNEWLTDGRISPDKKHQWLIKAHLSIWGGAQRAKYCGAPFLSLSTWLPGADSLVHGYVWSALLLPACTQSTTNCIIQPRNV